MHTTGNLCVCTNEILDITVRRLHHPWVYIHSPIGVKHINYVIPVYVYMNVYSFDQQCELFRNY